MGETNRFEALVSAYTNPTKMSILFLLAGNGKMTVTGMSEYVDVSRSNLYHYVSQLVEDGLLNEPEVVPRKNYVEKYYTLNEEVFQAMDPKEWVKFMNTLSKSEIRSLISSTLMALSMQLKMSAEKMSKIDDDGLEEVSQWMLDKPFAMIFSSLSASAVSIASRQIENLFVEMAEKKEEKGGEREEERGILVISLLPIILARL